MVYRLGLFRGMDHRSTYGLSEDCNNLPLVPYSEIAVEYLRVNRDSPMNSHVEQFADFAQDDHINKTRAGEEVREQMDYDSFAEIQQGICPRREVSFPVDIDLNTCTFSESEKLNRRTIPPTEWERRLLKGQIFNSWEEFDRAMDDYEGNSGMVVRRIHRNTLQFRGRCRGWIKGNPNSCQMEVVVRRLKKSGTISVRKANFFHTCPLSVHAFRNGANRSRWVEVKMFDYVKVNRDAKVKHLQKELRDSYQTTNSQIWTVARAKAHCERKINLRFQETFQQIPAYANRLIQADPNVHVEWNTGPENRFERLYVSPSSSQHAFRYCRPVVCIDGTHTSGEFPMFALLATCYDGENQFVVLAWAIVPLENDYNWCWFLSCLRTSYPEMLTSPHTFFMSDKEKGFRQVLARELPTQHHAYCVEGIKRSMMKRGTDDEGLKFFSRVVAAKSNEEYEELLNCNILPKTQHCETALVRYIKKIDPREYARHAFPSRRWGRTISNVVEVINAAIEPCRILPALLLSDEIWHYSMENHHKRQLHAESLPNGELFLTNLAEEMLHGLNSESLSVTECRSSSDQALMADQSGTYVLSVDEKHCDCRDWQEMDFPCVHLVRFEINKGRDVRRHAGECWLASNYKETYKVPIPPVSIDNLVKGTVCAEPLIDPLLKKKLNKNKKGSHQVSCPRPQTLPSTQTKTQTYAQ